MLHRRFTQTIEAMAPNQSQKDLGDTPFVIGKIVHQAKVLRLVDAHDNSHAPGAEALAVRELVLGPNTTLDLNGLNRYLERLDLDPSAVIDTSKGGQVIRVKPPRAR